MKMTNKDLFLLTVLFLMGIVAYSQEFYISKYTAINATTLTDVVYVGSSDTVLVSTRNGKISKRVHGRANEWLVHKVDDEVYGLAWNPIRREIAATTFESGIVIIHESTGKLHKRLPLKSSWSTDVSFSDNNQFLFANDLIGNRFLWDVNSQYKPVSLPDSFPVGRIISIDKNDIVTVVGAGKLSYWDMRSAKLLKNYKGTYSSLCDINNEYILLIDFNECHAVSLESNTKLFTLKHPSWPFPNPDDGNKIVDIPFSMQLTTAKFLEDKIVTTGIDRSIRIWDQKTGSLVKTIAKHTATVNKICVSSTKKQFVSIDLKGEINFWTVD